MSLQTRIYAFATPLKGFPNWYATIEDIAAEGDKVWLPVKGRGTPTGELRGVAPTGKKTTWEGVGIWRLVEGKIVEMLGNH